MVKFTFSYGGGMMYDNFHTVEQALASAFDRIKHNAGSPIRIESPDKNLDFLEIMRLYNGSRRI